MNCVIQPKTRTQQGETEKKKKRITIKQAKDTFVLHIKQICDFKTEIDKLQDRCSSSKTTLQPLIVVVGEDISNSTDFYVYFDDVKYKLTSFVSSIDLCFKIFHVFDLKYPEYCEGVWNFIHKYFFDSNGMKENIFPNVCGLVSYLKNIQ